MFPGLYYTLPGPYSSSEVRSSLFIPVCPFPKENGFIKWVDNVNWPPLRDSVADISSISSSSEG